MLLAPVCFVLAAQQSALSQPEAALAQIAAINESVMYYKGDYNDKALLRKLDERRLTALAALKSMKEPSDPMKAHLWMQVMLHARRDDLAAQTFETTDWSKLPKQSQWEGHRLAASIYRTLQRYDKLFDVLTWFQPGSKEEWFQMSSIINHADMIDVSKTVGIANALHVLKLVDSKIPVYKMPTGDATSDAALVCHLAKVKAEELLAHNMKGEAKVILDLLADDSRISKDQFYVVTRTQKYFSEIYPN